MYLEMDSKGAGLRRAEYNFEQIRIYQYGALSHEDLMSQ